MSFVVSFCGLMRNQRQGAKKQIQLWVVALALLSTPLVIVNAQQPDKQLTREEPITIPDGTPVELRFGQAVWGSTISHPSDIDILIGYTQAKPGDTVRLMSVGNVRIEDRVVIAKGAPAQATITSVFEPDHGGGFGYNFRAPDNGNTGLILRLDWIKSSDGTDIPLRASQKGKSKPFLVEVLTMGRATLAQPWSVGTIKRAFTWSGWMTSARKKNWIQSGTRIQAFAGSVRLDRLAVAQAQAELPVASPTSKLTIYRIEDHNRQSPVITCDGKAVGQLGAREHTSLEVPSGQHFCGIGPEKPIEFNLATGDECFVRLHQGDRGWELKVVTVGEGEDDITNSESLAR